MELPLGATEDRICGTIDIEKALGEGIKAYEPGLLVGNPEPVLQPAVDSSNYFSLCRVKRSLLMYDAIISHRENNLLKVLTIQGWFRTRDSAKGAH